MDKNNAGQPECRNQTKDPKIIATTRKPTHQPMMRFDAIPGFVSEFLIAGTSTTQNLILFTILTAVRSANARTASWAEFDLANRIWSIPPEKMKVDKPLRVPLSTGVLDILERQRGLHPVLVFSSPRELMLSDMAMMSFLRKHNAPSDVEGRTATAHGFRSSFKIWAVEAGHLDELSEIALGHSVGNKVSRAYRRTDQLDPIVIYIFDLQASQLRWIADTQFIIGTSAPRPKWSLVCF